MTTKAFIKQSDLIRMAKVAKEFNVVVWYEENGVRIGVSPEDKAETAKRKQEWNINL